MTITPQQLIALLPLLIVGLTVVVVMLSIASVSYTHLDVYKRQAENEAKPIDVKSLLP